MSVEIRDTAMTSREQIAEAARLLTRHSELSRQADMWQNQEFLDGLLRRTEMMQRPEFLDGLSRFAEQFEVVSRHVGQAASQFEASWRDTQQAMSRFAEQFAAVSRHVEKLPRHFEETHHQALASLRSIGEAMNAAQPFAESGTALLRANLGDWRAVQTWPDAIFRDPLARTDFYHSLGFAEHLTAFPEPAFYGMLGAVNLEADEGERFSVNCDVYKLLLRFERKLRKFIDAVMTRRFGPAWIKHRVPGEVVQRWKEKRQLAQHGREPERPLIEYADFTDYIRIIERRDNWREVFGPVFGRREDIQEAFNRLRPIRLSTMHARLITSDDAILVWVETRRILKAIKSVA